MSNFNKILYKGRTIRDEDLAIGGGLTNNMMLYQALISEELKPDTFTFNLIYDKDKLLFLVDANGKYLQDVNGKFLVVRADEFDPEQMAFGDTLRYYTNDGAMAMGKWVVRSVRRIQRKIYRFECMSPIGLLTYRGHNGGIYQNSTVGTVIADIMGDIPHYVIEALSHVKVTGWLPKVQAARDNLQAVLFMSGAVLGQYDDGSYWFGYPPDMTDEAKHLDDVNLNVGGTVAQMETATRVEVTAHEYHAYGTEESEVLFDNSSSEVAVYNQMVVFNGPYHSLNFGELSEIEHGDNYAIVSGIGQLTGKPYTHSTILYGLDTGVKAQPNIIRVQNNYLINIQNAVNVARRVANYYSVSREVNYTFRVNGEKPGNLVSFTDPFGDQHVGHIKSMNVTLSKRLNAAATIAIDWTPGPFGDAYNLGHGYEQSDIVNGRLTLEQDMVGSPGLVIMFSGAGGGQAGFDGEDGQAPNTYYDYDHETIALGGKGGKGGTPGERGRMLTVFVDELPAYFDNVVIGSGGPGGASNGALGQPGQDTSIGTWTTANGQQLMSEYHGPGAYLIGVLGEAGKDGKDGGIGSGRNPEIPDLSTDGGAFERDVHRKDPRTGQIVHEHIVDYAGGTHSNPQLYSHQGNSSLSGGAGGGGAAWGDPGKDAVSSSTSYDSWGGDGGDGGAGASYYRTWTGDGGQGGGGGGGAFCGYSKGASQTGFSYGGNHGGKGGKGGAGGPGGPGYIIIMYRYPH